MGIDPHYADQIFEGVSHPSATCRFGGLGIRLNLIKEIVTRHKGKVWLESKTGQGANFHFTLPTPEP
jgi:light-regulated signal transduction histidine kinase (bacteriophytochrome)